MDYSSTELVYVTQEMIVDFINKSNTLLIVAKPAYFEVEMQAIICIVKNKNIKCRLFMESGEQTIRLGFGEVDALKSLKDFIFENEGGINIQIVKKLRLSFIVSDMYTLLFAPDISFLDSSNEAADFPNGILGDIKFTTEFLRYFEPELTEDMQASEKVIPFPGCENLIIAANNQNIINSIAQNINSLEISPPVNPANLKKINIYRNNYKIIKMTVNGVKLQDRKISLKPFNSMISSLDKRLKSSWNIFSEDDIKNFYEIKIFENELLEIQNKYLHNARRFGYLLKLENKKSFINELVALEKEYKMYVTGNSEVNKENNRFIRMLEGKSIKRPSLKYEIEKSFDDLFDFLLPQVYSSNSFTENVIQKSRELRKEYEEYNRKIPQTSLKKYLKSFIYDTLRFPNLTEIINRVSIQVDYYDISDEMLTDETFNEIIKDFEKGIREYSNALENKF
ncbi:MAG: hypothetical protein Q7S39_01555 [Ignavibacteria bacterium]|nr:hypothetical protein [Ignavibacteria bacterium]